MKKKKKEEIKLLTVDEMLAKLNMTIDEFTDKLLYGRFSNKESLKLRVSYANALSNMVRAYSTLYNKKEREPEEKKKFSGVNEEFLDRLRAKPNKEYEDEIKRLKERIRELEGE